MLMVYKTITLTFLWLATLLAGQAQTWTLRQVQGGSGLEALDRMRPAANEEWCLGGRFSSAFFWEGLAFSPRGGQDVFFGLADAGGSWIWNRQIGSTQDDELLALASTREDEVVALGSYRGVLELGDTSLVSPQGNKSLFLCSADVDQLNWALSLDGRGLKGGGDLRRVGGNIWATCFFGDTLRVRDIRFTASGDTDALLLQLSDGGEVVQALTFGGTGDVRSRKVLPLPGGDLVLAGVFNDTLRFADTTLAAGTFDNDIFLLRFSPGGDLRWAKRLGGVLDNEITGLELTPTGALALSGYFSGLLNFEEDIALQSTNAQPDGFVALLDLEGQTLAAISFGGAGNVRALDLQLDAAGHLSTCGTFNGTLQADPFQIKSSGQQSGFVLRFRDGLEVDRLLALRSDEVVFLSSLGFTAQDELLIGGSFSGTLQHEGMPQADQFDLLLASTPIAVAVQEVNPEGKPRLVQTDRSRIQLLDLPDACDGFQLLDLQGRVLRSGALPPGSSWNLSGLPPGGYLLYLQCGSRHWTYRFVRP